MYYCDIVCVSDTNVFAVTLIKAVSPLSLFPVNFIKHIVYVSNKIRNARMQTKNVINTYLNQAQKRPVLASSCDLVKHKAAITYL